MDCIVLVFRAIHKARSRNAQSNLWYVGIMGKPITGSLSKVLAKYKYISTELRSMGSEMWLSKTGSCFIKVVCRTDITVYKRMVNTVSCICVAFVYALGFSAKV